MIKQYYINMSKKRILLLISWLSMGLGAFTSVAFGQENGLDAMGVRPLQEVVVTARQDLFKLKGVNKYVYEVYKDSTLKGASTLDALSRVPILAVRKSGSVESMNGRQLVFKINGLNHPLLQSLSQALTAIPANVIKSIEFKEDFSNSGQPILEVNIITKGRLEGILLQLQSEIRDNKWENSIWAVSKVKRLTFQGGYSNKWLFDHQSTSKSEEYRFDSPETYLHVSETKNNGYKTDLHDFFFTASYDVDDKSFISLYARALLKTNPHLDIHESHALSNEEGEERASYHNDNITKLKDTEYQVSVKYEKDLTSGNLPGSLNIGYEFYARPINQTAANIYTLTKNDLGEGLAYLDLMNSRSKREHRYLTNTVAADWTKETSINTQWSISGKLRTRDENYENQMLLTPIIGDISSYTECYDTKLKEYWGSVTPKFAYYQNDKWEVRGGFTTQFYIHQIKTSDQTDNIIKRHVIIHPFISAGLMANKNITLRMAFSTDENIPDITALNPYIVRTDAGIISYGNPDLKPETTYNLGLGINAPTGKLFSGATVNASYKKDLCLRYNFVEDGIMNQTYGNIANCRSVSFGGFSSGRVHRNTYLRFKVSADWVEYSAESLSQRNNGWSFGGQAYVEQELPWGVTLGGEVSYYSPTVFLQGRGGNSFNYDINLFKQFFDRKLTIIVDASSFIPIWYTRHSSSFGPSYSSTTWDRTFHAAFSLTLRYAFGKLNAKVKNGSARMDNSDIKKSYSE